MAYQGTPSTRTIDAVRLLVHDVSTSTGAVLLADAEYTYFIDNEPNVYMAGAEAARSIGARFGDKVASKRVGDLQIDYGQGRTVSYTALSRELRLKGIRKGVQPYAGGISESDKQTAENDADWNRPAFREGWSSVDSDSTGEFSKVE